MKEKYTLQEILGYHTATDLKDMAKTLGLRGYSKLKKDELVTLVSEGILDEGSLTNILLAATDRELDDIEEAMKRQVTVEPGTTWRRYWCDLCMAFVSTDGEVEIPIELEKAYNKIKKSKDYQSLRERTGMFHRYAMACTNLYVLIPMERFLDIMNTQTGLNVTEQDMIQWCELREDLRGCEMYFYKDGYIMGDIYGDNLLGVKQDENVMLAAQGNKPYYVPAKEELLRYEDQVYVEQNQSYKNMLNYMRKHMYLSEEKAEEYGAEIQLVIRSGAKPNDVVNRCSQLGMTFNDNQQVNDFVKYLMDMFQNTRMPENRGFTANEIQTMFTPGAVVQRRNTEKKVYPNDPCPCGSGKKYKKCCGK